MSARVVLSVVVSGLALIGPAGDPTDNGGRVPMPPTCDHPDPGVTDATITVGVIAASSGPLSIFDEAADGVRARFAAENEIGGVGGRRLLAVQADDGDGEIANLGAARELIAQDQAFGVVEISTSSEGSGPFLADEQIPVTGWAITPSWGTYRNMFGYRFSTSPKPEGEPITRQGEFFRDHGATRVGIVAGGAVASINIARQIGETLPALGLELAYSTFDVPLGANDFRPIAAEMAAAGVDGLYTAMGMQANVALYQALRDAGVDLKVAYFPSGYDGRVAAAFGSALEGVYFATDWRPFELPVAAHERFRRAMNATAPDSYPGQLAMVGWLSADTFIRGLREAGASCPTRRAFIANLRLVDDYTADGLVSPTDFSAEFGQMPTCSWMLQMRAGRFEPVGSDELCGVPLSEYRS